MISATQTERLVGHIARDSSAIEARERFAVPAKPKRKPAKKGKKKRKKHVFARKTAISRAIPKTRLERQLQAKNVGEMLKGVSTTCDIGIKTSNNGHQKFWRGYKLHLDVADGQIPISALITAASVHDSQVAIPLMEMSSQRVTYLRDVMDSAYDAKAIRTASRARNHQPIINPRARDGRWWYGCLDG